MTTNPTSLPLAIALLVSSSLVRALPADYDVLDSAQPAKANAVNANIAGLLDNQHPLLRDELTQLPSFLWAAQPANNSKASSKPSDSSIEHAARAHLNRYASLYQLTKTAQASASLHSIHHLAGNSGHIVRFNQHLNGVEVLSKQLNILLTADLQLSAMSGQLAPQLISASSARSAFKRASQEAIAIALADLQQQKLSSKNFKLSKQQGAYQWYSHTDSQSPLTKAVRLKKIYYPLQTNLEAAYYLELTTNAASYAYVISASNSQILLRHNLKRQEAATPFTYRVWADSTSLMPYDSPYGNDLTPLLISSVSKPITPVASQLISLSCGPISSCDPWLAAGATRTVGNNVKAYADLNAPDGYSKGDLYGKVSSVGTFDYDYNFKLFDDLEHSKQLQAAITQAFYTTNFMHDWLYDHGFNEISGNGQSDNFKRGGSGNDAMQVEINDYSGTDNANMTTPLDGQSPTMQLFLWLNDAQRKLSVNLGSATKNYPATYANFGKKVFNLKDKAIVLADDGVIGSDAYAVGTNTDGCEPIINKNQLAGAIALIDRGLCSFAQKAKNAQDAGAIAVLIANNITNQMGNMDNSGNRSIDNAITIGVLGINKSAGNAIKTALTQHAVLAQTFMSKQYPPYNSALDNSIIIHEWTHFLSDRLAWLANNQGRSMGEGWSDFLALVAMVKESDRNIAGNEHFQAPYAVSQYANSVQLYSYPLGIRRYPYSTDLNVNPLTFKHISNGVALPEGIAHAPNIDMSGSFNAEVHNSGEVWTAILWEVYVGLLNDTARLSFNEAQNRMLDYLVASLKLTPANPNFLEARDALLVVAKARDNADYQLFWKAFAKRGAGLNAIAPKHHSKTHKGVVEDFTTP